MVCSSSPRPLPRPLSDPEYQIHLNSAIFYPSKQSILVLPFPFRTNCSLFSVVLALRELFLSSSPPLLLSSSPNTKQIHTLPQLQFVVTKDHEGSNRLEPVSAVKPLTHTASNKTRHASGACLTAQTWRAPNLSPSSARQTTSSLPLKMPMATLHAAGGSLAGCPVSFAVIPAHRRSAPHQHT